MKRQMREDETPISRKCSPAVHLKFLTFTHSNERCAAYDQGLPVWRLGADSRFDFEGHRCEDRPTKNRLGEGMCGVKKYAVYGYASVGV